MEKSPYENEFTLSLKKYPLLSEQKSMLENLIPMFKSNDPETVDLARNLVLNEPLLNIMCGTPTCKQNAKTLHNRVAHCKIKRTGGSGKYNIFSVRKALENYWYMAVALEATVKYGYYYLYD